MLKIQNGQLMSVSVFCFENLVFWTFEIVSDFVLQILTAKSGFICL